MEVADRIVIIREGRLEQVGSPAECYDHPANEFVLTFLGPATRIGGTWVRPHDLVLSRLETPGSLRGRLQRIIRLGFETRVEVVLDDGTETWVQLAGRAFEELSMTIGDEVYVSMNEAHEIPAVTATTAGAG